MNPYNQQFSCQQMPHQQSYPQQQYGQQPQPQPRQQQPYTQQAYVHGQPHVQQSYSPQPYVQQVNQGGAQAHTTLSTTTTTSSHQLLGNQQSIYQTPNTPMPQPTPAINYMQLLQQPAPQAPQPPIDYTQLQQQPKPQPPIDYTPLQKVNNTSAVTETNITTTTKTTDQSARVAEEGGRARQKAVAKGEAALRRFDETVQEMLMSASTSACPVGFIYYRVEDGYLCGGGHHFVSHDDVDAMLTFGIPPRIEHVNSPLSPVVIFPPSAGWHEPMHRIPFGRLTERFDGPRYW